MLPAAMLTLLGCGSSSEDADGAVPDVGTGDAATDSGEDAAPSWLPPARCSGGTRYAPGTAAFVDATERWGLGGVEGTRISLGDIDGDGFVDVFVRRGGARSNEWGIGGTRSAWLLRNTGAIFEDVTRDSGVDDPRIPGAELGRPLEVVAFADVDNDGDLDLYTGVQTYDVGLARGETSEIMLNAGGGLFSFTRDTNAIRRRGQVDTPGGATFVDVDRDGIVDLWVPQSDYTPPGGGLSFAQDRLYRGAGDGMFVDITELSGLTTRGWDEVEDINAVRSHSRAWSATACDLNGDGTPELMAASYGRAPNHLWQGVRDERGAVTFANRSVASGYAFDEDQSWQDNQFARCFCQQNPAEEGCDGVEPPQIQCSANWRHDLDREPFRSGGNSGTTVCADLDNDGWLDLLTTEIKHWWAGDGADQSDILLNLGRADVAFDRERERELMGFVVRHPTSPSWDEGHMTAAVLDFDNDGWPDFYIGASDYAGNQGLLYHQEQPGFWREVPATEGIAHNRSHGVAVADFDRDGDLDLLVGHSRSRCDDTLPNDCYPTAQVRLFENVLGEGGNWLQLDLEGVAANRSAIGARVTVTAGEVTQTQEVGGGYGHFGAQNDRVLHFGLGAECEAQVTIRWPDLGLSEERFMLVSGYRYAIRQGDDPVALVE